MTRLLANQLNSEARRSLVDKESSAFDTDEYCVVRKYIRYIFTCGQFYNSRKFFTISKETVVAM
jgi:hypothetical protein